MLLLENLKLFAIKADMYVLNSNDENDFNYTELLLNIILNRKNGWRILNENICKITI